MGTRPELRNVEISASIHGQTIETAASHLPKVVTQEVTVAGTFIFALATGDCSGQKWIRNEAFVVTCFSNARIFNTVERITQDGGPKSRGANAREAVGAVSDSAGTAIAQCSADVFFEGEFKATSTLIEGFEGCI